MHDPLIWNLLTILWITMPMTIRIRRSLPFDQDFLTLAGQVASRCQCRSRKKAAQCSDLKSPGFLQAAMTPEMHHQLRVFTQLTHRFVLGYNTGLPGFDGTGDARANQITTSCPHTVSSLVGAGLQFRFEKFGHLDPAPHVEDGCWPDTGPCSEPTVHRGFVSSRDTFKTSLSVTRVTLDGAVQSPDRAEALRVSVCFGLPLAPSRCPMPLPRRLTSRSSMAPGLRPKAGSRVSYGAEPL